MKKLWFAIPILIFVACTFSGSVVPLPGFTWPWQVAAADAGAVPNPGVDAGVNPGVDAGNPGAPDAGNPQPPPLAAQRLVTIGNRIFREDGSPWVGHGANIHDTRGCNACTWEPPNVGEVIRRVDELVAWGARFVRLNLESYAMAEGRTHYQTFLVDPGYLNDIETIVRHIGTYEDTYVLLSLWDDPSFVALGWPSSDTAFAWEVLSARFALDNHVMFGIVNEPEHNYDGAQNAQVHAAMTESVLAIRAVEDGAHAPHHLIAVQGTGGWSRHLDYYTTHPIASDSIVYEVHVYDPQSEFVDLVTDPAMSIPVIIGEYGPAQTMTTADTAALQSLARTLGIPSLAWTFHGRCPPNLLVDHSGGGCGVGMRLEATAWGAQLRGFLSR